MQVTFEKIEDMWAEPRAASLPFHITSFIPMLQYPPQATYMMLTRNQTVVYDVFHLKTINQGIGEANKLSFMKST